MRTITSGSPNVDTLQSSCRERTQIGSPQTGIKTRETQLISLTQEPEATPRQHQKPLFQRFVQDPGLLVRKQMGLELLEFKKLLNIILHSGEAAIIITQ